MVRLLNSKINRNIVFLLIAVMAVLIFGNESLRVYADYNYDPIAISKGTTEVADSMKGTTGAIYRCLFVVAVLGILTSITSGFAAMTVSKKAYIREDGKQEIIDKLKLAIFLSGGPGILSLMIVIVNAIL